MVTYHVRHSGDTRGPSGVNIRKMDHTRSHHVIFILVGLRAHLRNVISNFHRRGVCANLDVTTLTLSRSTDTQACRTHVVHADVHMDRNGHRQSQIDGHRQLAGRLGGQAHHKFVRNESHSGGFVRVSQDVTPNIYACVLNLAET